MELSQKKPAHNNVYNGHAQQKLVTPHIRDRYTSGTDKAHSLHL